MRFLRTAGAIGLLLTLTASRAGADEASTSSVADILQVLADRGLVDADTQARILAKSQAPTPQVASGALGKLLGGWDLSGDLRLRHETFRFKHDASGATQSNRYRLRYRARLAARKQLLDWLGIGFRVVSGGSDPRSTNQTAGSGADFDTDPLMLDQAWARFTLPTGMEGLEVHAMAGKIPNPFTWKHGKDFLIWDHDITLEGATLSFVERPAESLRVFGNFGYLIPEELSGGADPTLYAAQLGGEIHASKNVRMGVRLSGYEWRPLRSTASGTGFIDRAMKSGNLTGAFDTRARIAELAGFIELAEGSPWPVSLHGSYIRNLLADPTLLGATRASDEDRAWTLGVEVGDKKKIAKLGFLYAHVEANAVIAQFTDSDLFDEKTNRKGFMVYGARQIAPHVDASVSVFQSREIESAVPFATSLANARRTRVQADLVVKFD